MLHLILFFVLLSVVLVLVVVAWRLWRKVLERKKGLEQENTERLKNILERTGYIHESLNVIALSLLEGQVRVAEAGIRMAVLLSNLSLDCEEKNRFSAVFEFMKSRPIFLLTTNGNPLGVGSNGRMSSSCRRLKTSMMKQSVKWQVISGTTPLKWC